MVGSTPKGHQDRPVWRGYHNPPDKTAGLVCTVTAQALRPQAATVVAAPILNEWLLGAPLPASEFP